jgi:hypothetical protein
LDLEDIGGGAGGLKEDDIIGLDLLANPRKIKKGDELPPPDDEEDFDDHNHDQFVLPSEVNAFSRTKSGSSERKNDDNRRRSDDRDDDRRRSDDYRRHESSRRHSDRRSDDRKDSRHRDRDYYDGGSGGGYYQRMSYEEQQRQRQKNLERFDRLMRHGIRVDKRFLNPNISVEEQTAEATRLEKNIEIQQSIQFQRKIMMAAVTGMEFLNHRFNPVGMELDGWSESVMEDINNYDSVFEELHDKYKTQVAMAPEFKLLVMLGGSAFMYHLTNTMFKSSMPGMGANGGGLAKGMRGAAMGAMGNFMGGNSGVGGFGGSHSQPPQGMRGGMGGVMSGMMPPGGAPSPQAGSFGGMFRGPSTNTNDLLNGLMEQPPQNINERIVQEIDDILNNPSDSDDDRPMNGRGTQDGITLDL